MERPASREGAWSIATVRGSPGRRNAWRLNGELGRFGRSVGERDTGVSSEAGFGLGVTCEHTVVSSEALTGRAVDGLPESTRIPREECSIDFSRPTHRDCR